MKTGLAHDRPQVGTWLSLASPMAARFLARAGLDWLTLDLEHSPADWETADACFAAVASAGCVPLARVPVNDLVHIKRTMDCGAWGIIVPMCNTPEEAASAVAACKYHPMGRRSVGGALRALSFETTEAEYFRQANDETLVVVQAEHVDAVENCQAIFSTAGVDAMFVGPNDLLASMGKEPAMDSDDPEFQEALRVLLTTAQRCGIAPGIHAGNAEGARRRIEEGWRFIAVGSDLSFMLEGARAAAAVARKGRGEAL